MSSELTVILQDIEYSTHLGKDQDSRSLGLHGLEELVENDHFTSIVDKVLVGGERWSRFLQISLYRYVGGREAYSSVEN